MRRNQDKNVWAKFGVPFITDLAGLQKYIGDNEDAIFVAFDVEGALGISELVISVLPPSALRQLVSGGDPPPSDLNDFAETYGLHTHSFRVNGKHNVKRGRGFRRGVLHFGKLQWVDEAELAEAVTANFLSIWNDCAGPGLTGPTGCTADNKPKTSRPLVLTGFHVGSEAYHLGQSLYQVLQDVPFAACVDVLDIVMSLSPSAFTSISQNSPSMKRAMQTAGLSFREVTTLEQIADGQFEDVGRRRQTPDERHAAGNDVVCELGLLAHILYAGVSKSTTAALSPLPTQANTPVPLLDRLRVMVEGLQRPLRDWRYGPTEEEWNLGENVRNDRLVKKSQEKWDALEDLEFSLSSFCMLDVDG